MPTQVPIMNVMNNINKVSIYFFLICLFLSFAWTGAAYRSEAGRVEAYLQPLEVVGLNCVIAVKEELTEVIQVEEFILKKTLNVDSSSLINLDHVIKYKHMPPVVMRGYRYLFFLTMLDAETETTEDKNKIICKIAGGSNGVVALFDLDELQNHPRVLRRKRIMPKYDFIQDLKNELQKNFGTTDGKLIKEAVERVVALYAEEDPKAQAEQLIESLRDGNPAMIRLSRELLQSIDLDAID